MEPVLLGRRRALGDATKGTKVISFWQVMINQDPKILLYAGGFAPVGGIESFLSDLAKALAKPGTIVELLNWDTRSTSLRELQNCGVKTFSLPWRWGCRWALPDWLLLPAGIIKSRSARTVVFGKTFRPIHHQILRRVCSGLVRPPKFVYVTPYRPAELWRVQTGSHEAAEVKRLLGTFDLIICQTATFEADLRQLGYTGQVAILPYLPPPVASELVSFAEGALQIGFLGRLEEQKDIPLLLEVFQTLHSQAASCGELPHLHFFGSGSLDSQIRIKAQYLGLKQAVTFYGNVSREDIPRAIGRCHLFCFTSQTEGQCLAALEILAQGRPVVATAVGALPGILDHPDLGIALESPSQDLFATEVKRAWQRIQRHELEPGKVAAAYQAKYDRQIIGEAYRKLLL